MAQTAGATHDISISVNSVERGFMLKRSKDGTKLWTCKSVDIIPASFITDRPSYANVPGRIIMPIEQKVFYGGIGEKIYESGTKYTYSNGADASFQDIVCAAGDRKIERRPTILNADFESGTVGSPPPDWTVVSGTPTIETSCASGGPYSGSKLCRLDAGDGIKQSFSTSGIKAGDMFDFRAAVGLLNGESIRVTIDCGVSSRVFTVTNSTGSPTWILRTYSYIIPSGFTELTIKFEYLAGSSSNAGVDYIGYAVPSRFCHFNGYLWLGRERYIERWHETNGWDWQDTLPQAVTDMAAYGSNLIIGQGAGNAYYYGSTTPFNPSTLGGSSTPQFDADVLGVCANIIWKSVGYSVYYTSNPISGTWTLAGQFLSYPLHIIDHPSTAYVATAQNLYKVDTTPSVSVVDDALADDAASDFGVNAIHWAGALYLPCGTCKLTEVTDILTDVSPGGTAPDETEYVVAVKALDGDDRFLYMVGLQANASPPIAWFFKGAERTVGSVTQWRWYPQSSAVLSSGGTVYDCSIYGGTTRRLFTATSDGVWYYHLPAFHGSPLSDSNYRYTTDGGILCTSWIDANYGLWNKSWRTLTVETSGCSASQYIEVYYQTEEGGSWTLLGSITSSPVQTLSFSSSPYSRRIRLKFIFFPSSATSTPVMFGYLLEAKLRSPARREITVVINLAGRVKLLQGGEVEQDVKNARDFLWQAFTSATPIVLKDEYNSSYNVDVDSFAEYYDIDPYGEEASRVVNMVMTETL